MAIVKDNPHLFLETVDLPVKIQGDIGKSVTAEGDQTHGQLILGGVEIHREKGGFAVDLRLFGHPVKDDFGQLFFDQRFRDIQ